jgi:hypothetical protein
MEFNTFILDFQTTNFENDSKIALETLNQYQKACGNTDDDGDDDDNNSNSLEREYFALDPPVSSAGWSFAKLFLAGQFIEKLYHLYPEKIEKSKGKKFEDKFVSWLAKELEDRKCQAKIKIAAEMR